MLTGEEKDAGRPLVLVVEDDPILMMTLVDFVEEAGCEAVEVHNVAEALEVLAGRDDIRTVLTDLDIRGSHAGLQLALAIRDRWPPIELLLVGARPYHASALPARGVLLGKPFEERKIVAALRRMAA